MFEVTIRTSTKEALSVTSVSRGIDRIEVTFDEPNLVANAGLVLVATLVVRLGLERLINAMVDLSGRVGGALPGRKVLTLVHAMVAGGEPHRPCRRAARRCHPGGARPPGDGTVDARHVPPVVHLRPCPSARRRSSPRHCGGPGALGAGPGSDRVVVDLDSTICEVCGKAKQGAGFGYTKKLGYHPLLATRGGHRRGAPCPDAQGLGQHRAGTKRFVEELVARLRRAGATGELVMRFDSGFWSNATIATLGRLGVGYTMGVRMVKSVVTAVSAINEDAWTPIDYTPDGIAEVAECDYKGRRLIVRRTRLARTPSDAVARVASLRLRDRSGGTAVELDAFHRAHARVELRHQGPQGGGGNGARPLGQLLRQRRLAAVRRPGPRPHPLDRHARRDHSRGPARGGAHGAHPILSVPGRLVSSSGTDTLRAPLRLAVGRDFRTGARSWCVRFDQSRCSRLPRGRRTADDLAGRR